LKELDILLYDLFQSLPKGSSFLLATQPSLVELHRMNEEKLRLRWEQRAYDSQQGMHGAKMPSVWSASREVQLSEETDKCFRGAAFFARK